MVISRTYYFALQSSEPSGLRQSILKLTNCGLLSVTNTSGQSLPSMQPYILHPSAFESLSSYRMHSLISAAQAPEISISISCQWTLLILSYSLGPLFMAGSLAQVAEPCAGYSRPPAVSQNI